MLLPKASSTTLAVFSITTDESVGDGGRVCGGALTLLLPVLPVVPPTVPLTLAVLPEEPLSIDLSDGCEVDVLLSLTHSACEACGIIRRFGTDFDTATVADGRGAPKGLVTPTGGTYEYCYHRY
mgnify:CR=1 FL=1